MVGVQNQAFKMADLSNKIEKRQLRSSLGEITGACPLLERSGLIAAPHLNVRFSNRPLGVKHFQTFHCCGFYVSRGLVLLFGIGT